MHIDTSQIASLSSRERGRDGMGNELELEILKREILTNDDVVRESISGVEAAFESHGVDAVLDVCLPHPSSVEFLLSAISTETYDCVFRHVLDHFPKTQQGFATSPLSWRLLTRLAMSAFFLPHDPDTSLHTYTADHHYIQHANILLEALPLIDIAPTPATPTFEEDEVPFMVKKGKGTQRARKQNRKGNQRKKSIDTTIFLTMDIDLPQTREEADKIAKDVLLDCKDILEELFHVFRQPALASTLKTNYIPSDIPDEDVSAAQNEGNSVLFDGDISLQHIAPSFPHVQPMKAAFHFESAEGFGDWHIYVSGRAKGHLREAKRKNANMFRIYLKKIKELSNGHFSADNQKMLTGNNTPIPIYEAKMTSDTRLVYQVDCIMEFESKVERQVIRIFGIYSHTQIGRRLWDSMGYQLSRRGSKYIKRCVHREPPHNKGDSVIPPKVWSPVSQVEVEEPVAPPVDTRKEDLEELHSLLVLEKFTLLSQSLLTNILADQDGAHVFQVSLYEQEIIEHDHSCYVLGRSGTGKTTTMLFKMLGLENSWQQSVDTSSIARPRQLFVTQSRVLADKVEEYFIKLLETLHTAASTEGDITELLARKKNREEAGLVDRDEAGDWREDLPRRFSELEDAHFPMFITLDKLSSLLEADMSQALSKTLEQDLSPATSPTQGPNVTSEYMLQKRQSFVSFDVFRDEYWQHFPQPLTKGLDPALVFSEFMGVIKGSEQTLSLPHPFLDRDAYLNLSARTQATFASRRKQVYALFEAYIKMRRERRDYDAADRTHAILREIQECGVKGKKLDFLYVDEVQDNLLIDAKLLRFLCLNPEGLFWAGDTAQTISVGSSFRFNDLKAFLHRLEESTTPQIQSKASRQPRTFELATNYRSHGGIVQCAHSVIQLITQFWPNAIDVLARERGIVDGIKPVFFSGWDSENVRYESFLFGEAGSHIEFGAQQCILVRNDAARDQLRDQVGDIGLILTLYESKGLEFNDVLLFNFFEDSTVDVSQWRVVLNVLGRMDRDGIAAPSFDEARHAGVCTELKFLYVAVTRARKNLWIVDRSEKGVPMRTLWMAQELVHHYTPGSDAELPKLAVASTPEEWGTMARTLFDNKRYFQAMHSYERAEMPRERAVASAYYLREQARSTPPGPRANDPRKHAFIKAAEAFVASAQGATRERNEYFRVAAELFVSAGEYGRAGDAFLQGQRYNEAAKNYRKAGWFGETVSTLKKHWNQMDESVANSLREVSRLYYFKQNDLKTASSLFATLEEKLEFVEQYNLDVALAAFLIEEGRYAEAADLHLQEGRTMEATGLYIRDYQSRQSNASLLKAKDCILQSLWELLSFDIIINPSDQQLQQDLRALFRHISRIDTNDLDENDRLEIEMFTAIQQGDADRLRHLGEVLSKTNKPAALLSLDHAFRDTQGLLAGTGQQVILTLTTYYLYATLLRETIDLRDSMASRAIQKLLRVDPPEDGHVQLSRGTFMFASCERFRVPFKYTEDGDIVIDQTSAQRLFVFSLSQRLRESIERVQDQALRVQVLDPCPTFAMTMKCTIGKDCLREHDIDKAWFHRRVRFYFLQGLILQIHGSLPQQILQRQTISIRLRIWLERVADALFPIHHAFGSAVVLNVNQIPEAKRGLGVLRDVIMNALYALDPRDQSPKKMAFASTLLRVMNLGFLFDRAAIRNYMHNAPTMNKLHAQHLLRPAGGSETRYVVHDLADLFQGSERTSLIAGILFFTHLLNNRIHIDIGVLCALLDFLASSCIFAKRMKYGTPQFHGLTLPRSWILARLGDLERLKYKEIRMFENLVDPIGALIYQLHTGENAGHLMYQGKPIKDSPQRVREIAITRICRTICLYGVNMGWVGLQRRVYYAVTSIRKPGQTYPASYRDYVQAPNWSRLDPYVTGTLTSSSLDEMVCLNHVERPATFAYSRVKRIKYRTIAEIPTLLKADGIIVSDLRVEATPFVPSAKPTVEAQPEPMATTANEEKDDDPEETKPEDVEAIILSMENDRTSSLSAEDITARNKAALTLFTLYRRRLRLRTSFIAPGLPTHRAKYFDACLKEAAKIQWAATSTYRFVFLGPLPHVLACLEAMINKMNVDRTKARIKMMVADHDDLEKVMEEGSKLNTLNKEIHALKKNLEPTSELHRARDLEALKPLIVRAKELVEEVGLLTKLDVDMAIVHKAIVQKKKQKLPEEKPSLNSDDLEE
ncbi:hypothetical protein OF83DRAFT_135754 [Amylostereum chailletii]|nr:hypothetical protein OF83DRAFT_135754 [Amylostereum chailletii]